MTETLYPHEVLIKYLKEPSPFWFSIFSVFVAMFYLIVTMILIAFMSFEMVHYHVLNLPYHDFIQQLFDISGDMIILLEITGLVSICQTLWEWHLQDKIRDESHD